MLVIPASRAAWIVRIPAVESLEPLPSDPNTIRETEIFVRPSCLRFMLESHFLWTNDTLNPMSEKPTWF